ncbi:SURF1 family protein [Williamsia sp. CHRR-6]|uniref:SURF1 family cytochrome oxidase biogenesis protein n=1 Tax=Williamsia sp. CHRR-6 TaxID=2835871 RepID=UPI001BDB291B|nr:SURF1 family cytochrome oxidase biogenesis protein [Williamsia sp. CHRR-6]MBT0565343.1 hypothetical protein [Williamsia sp. CHRR-6]
MSWLRTFIRPGWVALAVFVVAFTAACFWVLAPWQLGKNSSTEQQNNQIKRAQKLDPVPIDRVYSGTGPLPREAQWREVTVRGRYLPDKQVVVRLRSIDDSPAFEVVTPFVADDGRTFAINRGYVRPVTGTALPAVTPAPDGPTSINARVRAPEGTAPGRGARVDAGVLQVYTIDPVTIGRAVELTLAPTYLQLRSGQPGSLAEIPLPQLDSGPYLSYGLQWIAFGVMAPLGLIYFVRSEVRHRRAQAQIRANALLHTETDDLEPEQQSPLPGDRATDQRALGDGPVTSRTARGRERRRMVAAASTSGVGGTRVTGVIGAGPDHEAAPDAVRRKLANRYGD